MSAPAAVDAPSIATVNSDDGDTLEHECCSCWEDDGLVPETLCGVEPLGSWVTVPLDAPATTMLCAVCPEIDVCRCCGAKLDHWAVSIEGGQR